MKELISWFSRVCWRNQVLFRNIMVKHLVTEFAQHTPNIISKAYLFTCLFFHSFFLTNAYCAKHCALCGRKSRAKKQSLSVANTYVSWTYNSANSNVFVSFCFLYIGNAVSLCGLSTGCQLQVLPFYLLISWPWAIASLNFLIYITWKNSPKLSGINQLGISKDLKIFPGFAVLFY